MQWNNAPLARPVSISKTTKRCVTSKKRDGEKDRKNQATQSMSNPMRKPHVPFVPVSCRPWVYYVAISWSRLLGCRWWVIGCALLVVVQYLARGESSPEERHVDVAFICRGWSSQSTCSQSRSSRCRTFCLMAVDLTSGFGLLVVVGLML